MKTVLAQLIIITVAFECGFTQEIAAEKHVQEITAEQTQKIISASALCQQVRAAGHGESHQRDIDHLTLEPDLASLFQKSDEVVLAGIYTGETRAISPSGNDVIQYFDVRVLRTWKGSHKVGDLLTFAVPWGGVYCGRESVKGDGSPLVASTLTGGKDWLGIGRAEPWILFLRYSRDEEKQLIPGFMLTGGDGLQGLFAVERTYDKDCTGILQRSASRCNTTLESSQDPVSLLYRLDPLKTKYDKMPISTFLKEVQLLADSLAATGQKTSN